MATPMDEEEEKLTAKPVPQEIQMGIAAGNINIDTAASGITMDLAGASSTAMERHAKLLQKVEMKRKAQQMVVPTKISEVMAMLRGAGEPVTVFGERPEDRTERLRQLLAARAVSGMLDGPLEPVEGGGAPSSAGAGAGVKKVEELFYTPAQPGLVDVRKHIAAYSFERASRRLSGARAAKQGATSEERASKRRRADEAAVALYEGLRDMETNTSQVGDVRPLSSCGFSADGAQVVTGSWSTVVKVWDVETCALTKSLKGHTERVLSVQFNPQYGAPGGGGGVGKDGAVLLTGAADSTAILWALKDEEGGEGASSSSSASAMEVEGETKTTNKAGKGTPLVVLQGHKDRLGEAQWHPSGRCVGTTSYDKTWRLWDVEAGGQEVLMQEGHASEVYSIAFQGDGTQQSKPAR